MEIKDLAGISEPTKKLIEVVSSAIGKLYEPRSIRNKADAEAYAVKALTTANGEAIAIEAEAQALAYVKQLEILANGDPELIQRARIRVLTREVEGQRNVEEIAEYALEYLPDSVSDQPISNDWRRKFFLEAENICDTDLQLLWGKVLAGETASPGSYSVRTLNVLKNLSKQEAEGFRIFCGLASDIGHVVYLGSDQLKEFGITYTLLLSLRDAGLLHEGDALHRHFREVPPSINSSIESNNGVYIELSGPAIHHIQIPCLPLTQAGRELQQLIPANPNELYFKAMAKFLRARGLTVKRGSASPISGHQNAMTISFDEDL